MTEAASVAPVAGPRRPWYPARLRRSWLWSRASAAWLALGLMPLLFFQTALHEGSHCVAMTLTGAACRVMAPFPLALGATRVQGATFGARPDEELALVAVVAPQILAAALVALLWLAARRTRDERWALLARLWLLGACVDLLDNTLWRPDGAVGDWSVMANQVGLSTAARLAVSLPPWLVGLAGLLAPLPADFAPAAGSLFDLAEIGPVYALVSALAVAVSLAVDVPGADRASLWYRVPILLHALTAAACLAIYAASRRTSGEAA